MKTAGWSYDNNGGYVKSEKDATCLKRTVEGCSGRRTVRDAHTMELIDELNFNHKTSVRRVKRQLRKPIDLVSEIYVDAIDEADGIDEDEIEMNPQDASLYRAITARINFLAQDRSDLQFASKECSRRMAAPRIKDWLLVKRVGRYLAGRPRAVSTFKWQDPTNMITAYADSNWAGCRDTRKSTSGACFMIGSHLIKSYSRTQSNIALSSAEAELYSFVTAASEAMGLKSMLRDFGVQSEANLQVDASVAIGIAQRNGLGKVRHLDCQSLWIQDAVRQRRIQLEKVLGIENPADLMTKNLDQKVMDKMLQKMGISLPEGRAQSAPTINKSSKAKIDKLQEANNHEDKSELQEVRNVNVHESQAQKYQFESGRRLVECWADEPVGCDHP